MSDIDVGFYGNTLNWLLKKDVLNKESCFALNFGYKGQLPFPQFSMNLQTYLSKNMPIVTWYVDPESRRFRGSIDGPPPGLLQSKCFLVFIGGQYLDQLGEVMEKVKSVGKAVRMGAPVLYCTVLYCTGEDGGALRCVHHEECEHHQPGPCNV